MTKIGDEAWHKDLAQRYKIAMIYGLYHVRTRANQGNANIAEAVARKHRRDGDIEYEREIRAALEGIESSNEYQYLLHGTATPTLVLNTLTWYRMVRSCR